MIWDLVLHVEPTSSDMLTIKKICNRDIVKEPGGDAPRPSVLTFLLTCRFILREAAGIFYAQQPVSFSGIERFVREVRYPGRLNGVQEIRIGASGFEELTMLCTIVWRNFQKLKALYIGVMCLAGTSTYEMPGLAREKLLLKRAVSRFPASLEIFEVQLKCTEAWYQDEWEMFQIPASKVFQEVFIKVPEETKSEVVFMSVEEQ